MKKKLVLALEIKNGIYINVPNLEKIRRTETVRCNESHNSEFHYYG